MWSDLGSANLIIAKLLNALATTAEATSGASSREGKKFEDGAQVGHVANVLAVIDEPVSRQKGPRKNGSIPMVGTPFVCSLLG